MAWFRTVKDKFAGLIRGEFEGDFLVHRELFLDPEFIDHEIVHSFGVGGADTDEITFLNAYLLEREPDAGFVVVGGGSEFFRRTIRFRRGLLLGGHILLCFFGYRLSVLEEEIPTDRDADDQYESDYFSHRVMIESGLCSPCTFGEFQYRVYRLIIQTRFMKRLPEPELTRGV